MTPTVAWYQAAGLGILGWACIAIWAGFAIHSKVQRWWVWAIGLIGALFTLTAGFYLADTGPVETIIDFIKDWPLVAFIVFVVVMVGIAKLPAQAAPDVVHAATITMGVAMFVLLLPSLVAFIPGKGGARVTEVMTSIGEPMKEHTADWFNPEWREGKSVGSGDKSTHEKKPAEKKSTPTHKPTPVGSISVGSGDR